MSPEAWLRDGFARIDGGLPADLMAAIRDEAFRPGCAGTRCLLDSPAVREAAVLLKVALHEQGFLPPTAVAVQAIGFDKSATRNWRVGWHQDVMHPFAGPVTTPGYGLPSRKDGVDHARPPAAVLERMLAARLHLDDCGAASGPLKVVPGTHRLGILRSEDIPGLVTPDRAVPCIASAGEVLLMRPLLLHASSKAPRPGHRRVLHLVFHDGSPIPERWHRQV